jgi:predicted transcriptional regulator
MSLLKDPAPPAWTAVTMRFPEELWVRVGRLASATKHSKTQVVVRILEAGVSQLEADLAHERGKGK